MVLVKNNSKMKRVEGMPFGQIKYTKSFESVTEWQGYAIKSFFSDFPVTLKFTLLLLYNIFGKKLK